MARSKAASVSGRDHYQEIFQSELSAEAEWLAFGAKAKATSVGTLLRRSELKPSCILELGCGTGAVIQECQRRHLAREFVAVDYSAEAIAYLRSRTSDIDCFVFDITCPDIPIRQNVDLVLLSHVLEHLEDPETVLTRIVRNHPGKWFILEVPLEDLFLARLKNRFRERGENNTAGHVQFFNRESFVALLRAAGLKVHDEHRYAPVVPGPVLERVCHKDGLSAWQIRWRRITQTYLPRMLQPLWSRFYYGHIAVLCSTRTEQSPTS